MLSLGDKAHKLFGLIDTIDVSPATSAMLDSVRQVVGNDGRDTRGLSTEEADWLDELYAKHFEGK